MRKVLLLTAVLVASFGALAIPTPDVESQGVQPHGKKHRHIVIPIAHVAAMNTWVETTWPGAGTDNFSVELSADGQYPATHVHVGWMLTDDRFAAMEAQIKKLMSIGEYHAGLSTVAGAGGVSTKSTLVARGLKVMTPDAVKPQ